VTKKLMNVSMNLVRTGGHAPTSLPTILVRARKDGKVIRARTKKICAKLHLVSITALAQTTSLLSLVYVLRATKVMIVASLWMSVLLPRARTVLPVLTDQILSTVLALPAMRGSLVMWT
jgi:hypothetical protein